MTIDEAIAGRCLAEWEKLARRDDCFDVMVPSDLRCILAALRREREPVEPVAWRWRLCYREEWCWSATKPMFSPRDIEQGTVFDVQPLYTTTPDALALVAAAYRDAATVKQRRCDSFGDCSDSPMDQSLQERILARTPADATAALAAIERAAYERGVRDTLAAADREAKGRVHIGGQAFRTVKLDDLEPAALALLTQEGR